MKKKRRHKLKLKSEREMILANSWPLNTTRGEILPFKDSKMKRQFLGKRLKRVASHS